MSMIYFKRLAYCYLQKAGQVERLQAMVDLGLVDSMSDLLMLSDEELRIKNHRLGIDMAEMRPSQLRKFVDQ